MERPNDNGGGYHELPQFMDPFVKREEEEEVVLDHTNKCASIAERRATKCGFNASQLCTLPSPRGGSPYLTIPSGISPSTLLDSPVMLPNIQAQSSPTTGTFQMKPANAQGFPNSSGLQNKPFEEIKYPKDLQEMPECEATLENFQELKNKTWVKDTNQSFLHTKNDIDNKCNERNTHQKGESSFRPKEVAKCSEDGYCWRKYGQKQVKGSQCPRSYFKCTNTSCQVKKKVECSHDGQITEIIYKGKHNHPQPQPFNRMTDQRDHELLLKGESSSTNENNDINMPGNSLLGDFSDQFLTTTETQEILSNFDIQDNEASPDNISLNDEYYEIGEREPKRRKKDSFPGESSISRSTREPRVVVQIESDIDILNDGYRWRKYGQKVVKGNPNPRSYYKCTTPGCPVRKHVERAADDKKSVITTYEGKHNHEVPSSKNSNLMISDVATNNSISNSLTMSHKHDHGLKSGKQRTQDLHSIYSEQNPMLNYNEVMWPNFGPSLPQYLFRIPSFPYNSHLLNGSYHTRNFPSSNISPMLPNYIPPVSMAMPMNHINPAVSGDMYGNNLRVNNYVAMQSSIQGRETKEYEAETVRPKEEP